MSEGLDVRVKIEAKHTQKAFNKLEKSQYPMALAKALTATAKDAQKAVISKTKRVFELHGRHTIRNIKIKPAKKTDVVSMRMAYSLVYTGKNIPYMPQHERGGIKVPRYEDYLAIPGRDMKKKRYRTSKGVKKQYHPEYLMQLSREAEVANKRGPRVRGQKKQKGRTTRRTAFIIKSPRKRTPVMVRRKSRARNADLEFLWVLVKRAKIKPTWKFEETVKRRARRTFPKHFRQAMAYAIRTAR